MLARCADVRADWYQAEMFSRVPRRVEGSGEGSEAAAPGCVPLAEFVVGTPGKGGRGWTEKAAREVLAIMRR